MDGNDIHVREVKNKMPNDRWLAKITTVDGTAAIICRRQFTNPVWKLHAWCFYVESVRTLHGHPEMYNHLNVFYGGRRRYPDSRRRIDATWVSGSVPPSKYDVNIHACRFGVKQRATPSNEYRKKKQNLKTRTANKLLIRGDFTLVRVWKSAERLWAGLKQNTETFETLPLYRATSRGGWWRSSARSGKVHTPLLGRDRTNRKQSLFFIEHSEQDILQPRGHLRISPERVQYISALAARGSTRTQPKATLPFSENPDR